MRTMKFLMCIACLCSAAVFARTAMTQEPVNPQNREPFTDPPLDHVDSLPARQKPTLSDSSFDDVPGMPARFPTPIMRPRRVTRTVIETVMEQIPKEELDASKKLQDAVQSLRTGKDDAARKAAADVIQQQLTTQFESDLKQREKELAEVEQRVKTLREQLDKRKAAQAEIINLRLQTLVNEANGLGFPDEDLRTNYPGLPQLKNSPPAVRYFESVPDSGGSIPTPLDEDPIDPRFADPNRRK